jgi:hypothetical protein
MNSQKIAGSARSNATERRAYGTPQLVIYGALRDLTEAGGSNPGEGGVGEGQKKKI